jgi:phosphate transport system protein
MTREYYIQQIKKLEQDLVTMGESALDVLGKSIKALENKDIEAAKAVIKESEKISDMELELENSCIEMLALQQPMASDLRFVTSTLKILTDLERLSRQAYDISLITLRIENEQLLPEITEIRRMFDIADKMVRDSLRAFVKRDMEVAKNMGERDNEIDALYDKIRRDLIDEMIKDPSTIDMASNLSFMARYIERTADHACVIASRTIYMVTGERLRIR